MDCGNHNHVSLSLCNPTFLVPTHSPSLRLHRPSRCTPRDPTVIRCYNHETLKLLSSQSRHDPSQHNRQEGPCRLSPLSSSQTDIGSHSSPRRPRVISARFSSTPAAPPHVDLHTVTRISISGRRWQTPISNLYTSNPSTIISQPSPVVAAAACCSFLCQLQPVTTHHAQLVGPAISHNQSRAILRHRRRGLRYVLTTACGRLLIVLFHIDS